MTTVDCTASAPTLPKSTPRRCLPLNKLCDSAYPPSISTARAAAGAPPPPGIPNRNAPPPPARLARFCRMTCSLSHCSRGFPAMVCVEKCPVGCVAVLRAADAGAPEGRVGPLRTDWASPGGLSGHYSSSLIASHATTLFILPPTITPATTFFSSSLVTSLS